MEKQFSQAFDGLSHGFEEQGNSQIMSELSSDEQLGELPLPRSKHSANAKAAKKKENMYFLQHFVGL